MASRRFAMSVKFGPREFGPKIKKEKSFASEAPWRKASIVLILSPNEPIFDALLLFCHSVCFKVKQKLKK